jgi:steroid delta-isomerase-like uncharacterized protein
MAQATALSPQALIDAAKAMITAYNDKNWDRVRASMATGFIYDEIATGRKTEGVDQAITLWQGWAQAFPDSKATFNTALASGNTVTLELTWRGTHKGPLQTPSGSIPATGKTIEVRACQVSELAADKVRSQRHYFDMATLLRQIGAA